MPVQPTGDTHDVAVDELFFSTTDRRGVITGSNSVFERLSRYPKDRLVGTPHNVIRHPDMPGGAFRLIWDMLLANKPTCAYVLNLAADGSAYWTFATMTSLDGGFLSVRSRPCLDSTKSVIREAYAAARAREDAARQAGTSSAGAAVLGADALTHELADLGFDSYDDFIRRTLPEEVAARTALSGRLAERPEAYGSARTLLNAVRPIHEQVARLGRELTAGHSLADDLSGDVAQAQHILTRIADSLRDMMTTIDAVKDRAPVVAMTGPKIQAKCERIAANLSTISERVHQMRALRSDVRFQVALAQLHSEAMHQFIIGVVDQVEDRRSARAGMTTLAIALHQGMDAATAILDQDALTGRALHEAIATTEDEIETTRLVLARWRQMVDAKEVASEVADMVPAMDDALGSLDDIGRLTQGVERLAASTIGFDKASVNRALRVVEQQALT